MASSTFWDNVAEKYAKSSIPNVEGYADTLTRIRNFLTRRSRVLEVGCGTGTTSIRLAPNARHIDATDYSKGLIAICERRLKEADPRPRNVTFSVADINKLPGKPGSYDAVLAMNMLHTLKDPDAGVNAMKEQLKSGGVMVTKTPALRGNLFYRVAIPVMRLVGKAPPIKFFSLAAITKLHTDAGLNIVETEDYEKGSRRLIIAKKP